MIYDRQLIFEKKSWKSNKISNEKFSNYISMKLLLYAESSCISMYNKFHWNVTIRKLTMIFLFIQQNKMQMWSSVELTFSSSNHHKTYCNRNYEARFSDSGRFLYLHIPSWCIRSTIDFREKKTWKKNIFFERKIQQLHFDETSSVCSFELYQHV